MAVEGATKVTLTEEQMEDLRMLCAALREREQLFEPLLRTWELVAGDAWLKAGPGELNPAAWAIPEEQAHQILNWWMEAGQRVLPGSTAVQVGLEWVNHGPASFKDGE